MMHLRAVRRLTAIASGSLVFAGTAAAQDQDTTARSTGLPKQIHWKFNFDAGVGAFGFGNSLYTQAHPDPSGNLGDDWIESYAKPALSAVYPLSTGDHCFRCDYYKEICPARRSLAIAVSRS